MLYIQFMLKKSVGHISLSNYECITSAVALLRVIVVTTARIPAWPQFLWCPFRIWNAIIISITAIVMGSPSVAVPVPSNKTQHLVTESMPTVYI